MVLYALWHTKDAVYAVARRSPLVRPQQRDTIAGSVAQRTTRLSSWTSSQARGSARPGIRAARRPRSTLYQVVSCLGTASLTPGRSGTRDGPATLGIKRRRASNDAKTTSQHHRVRALRSRQTGAVRQWDGAAVMPCPEARPSSVVLPAPRVAQRDLVGRPLTIENTRALAK
ncbi:hypothetical protein LA080_012636 [Diaporthe eres]|nr:hypothetical protein LA080_012636 [Diaporthe eres]